MRYIMLYISQVSLCLSGRLLHLLHCIPPDFFDLLENTQSTQSVASHNKKTCSVSMSEASQHIQTTTTTQTYTNSHNHNNGMTTQTSYIQDNQHNTRQSISTQTKSARNIRWAPKTEHKHTNTTFTKMVDKSTNSEPLIVLDPIDIKSLHIGLYIATYNPEHQIFMSTNNSQCIIPLPNRNQNITSTTTIHGYITSSSTNPTIHSHGSTTQTTKPLIGNNIFNHDRTTHHTLITHKHQTLQPATVTHIDSPDTTDPTPDTPKSPKNTHAGYKLEQLKIKKRVQWDSHTISDLLKSQRKQKCDVSKRYQRNRQKIK